MCNNDVVYMIYTDSIHWTSWIHHGTLQKIIINFWMRFSSTQLIVHTLRHGIQKMSWADLECALIQWDLMHAILLVIIFHGFCEVLILVIIHRRPEAIWSHSDRVDEPPVSFQWVCWRCWAIAPCGCIVRNWRLCWIIWRWTDWSLIWQGAGLAVLGGICDLNTAPLRPRQSIHVRSVSLVRQVVQVHCVCVICRRRVGNSHARHVFGSAWAPSLLTPGSDNQHYGYHDDDDGHHEKHSNDDVNPSWGSKPIPHTVHQIIQLSLSHMSQDFSPNTIIL